MYRENKKAPTLLVENWSFRSIIFSALSDLRSAKGVGNRPTILEVYTVILLICQAILGAPHRKRPSVTKSYNPRGNQQQKCVDFTRFIAFSRLAQTAGYQK